MAIIIPIKDNPNHSITIELESTIYQLVFRFNTVNEFWTMDILTEDGVALLNGIKIVPNYPLIFTHKNSLLPNGDFIAQIADSSARITRNTFSNGSAKLLYLTQDELKTL
jgi:hypothetical protein